MNWIPIATPPKGRERVLYTGNPAFPHLVCIGFYANGHVYKGDVVPQASTIPREWIDVATHWMPLPISPHETKPKRDRAVLAKIEG